MEFNNFKAPFPPRRAANNNTRSTYNNGVLSDDLKQVEERYEVLKKICPPEDVAEILRETVNHLNAAVYEKMAERLNVRPSNSQAPSVGGSSIYSFNPRPIVPSSAVSDYGPRPPQESTGRRINSTAASKNYGLTNTLVPNRHTVLSTDQFSGANEIIYEVEPSIKTHPKQIRTKNPTFTFGFTEKQVDGLSIPITMKKPNPPVSQPKRPTKKELTVVPSDDESDISIFGTTRRVSGKEAAKTEKPTNTRAHNLSVSLKRIPVEENESASRKRKASNEDIPLKKKSPPEVETRPSPDTTTSNVATGKPSKPANETLRRTTRNVSIRKQETAAKSKENKENKKAVKPKTQKEPKKPKAKTAPVVEEDAEVNDDVFDDGAFFGDVSSIIGSDSLALTNTIAKNTTKHSTAATLVPLHSFSPFANIRSTSGVSAISTPLSKSLAKNVLGKRIKKPSVVAELRVKNVQSRKPRKDVVQAVVAAPAPDNISEESNGETSDFSD